MLPRHNIHQRFIIAGLIFGSVLMAPTTGRAADQTKTKKAGVFFTTEGQTDNGFLTQQISNGGYKAWAVDSQTFKPLAYGLTFDVNAKGDVLSATQILPNAIITMTTKWGVSYIHVVTNDPALVPSLEAQFRHDLGLAAPEVLNVYVNNLPSQLGWNVSHTRTVMTVTALHKLNLHAASLPSGSGQTVLAQLPSRDTSKTTPNVKSSSNVPQAAVQEAVPLTVQIKLSDPGKRPNPTIVQPLTVDTSSDIQKTADSSAPSAGATSASIFQDQAGDIPAPSLPPTIVTLALSMSAEPQAVKRGFDNNTPGGMMNWMFARAALMFVSLSGGLGRRMHYKSYSRQGMMSPAYKIAHEPILTTSAPSLTLRP